MYSRVKIVPADFYATISDAQRNEVIVGILEDTERRTKEKTKTSRCLIKVRKMLKRQTFPYRMAKSKPAWETVGSGGTRSATAAATPSLSPFSRSSSRLAASRSANCLLSLLPTGRLASSPLQERSEM